MDAIRVYCTATLLFFILCVNFFRPISSHVALTYPPARKYDLDFLDNSRTKGPCGMPKGLTRTSFAAGSAINVTWHLAYAHRGGFSLQLLDHLERPVLDLTPKVSGVDFVRTDATAQRYEVKFPNDFTCDNCTLRLLRQADEWSNGYRFWSCADIDIKPRKGFREQCSGKGKFIASRCKCEKRYYGSRCQYSDECSVDRDCGVQGKCVNLQGTAHPKRQCFCNFGWSGPDCSKKSAIKSKDLDLSLYKMKQLSPDYRLHWRILKEKQEIEFVVIVNGTSWVGLGWRPRQLTAKCRNFPYIDGGEVETKANLKAYPEVSAEPHPEGVSEPASEVSAEPKPEGAAEPEPESEVEPEPSSKLKAEPKPEGAAEPEPKSEVEPEPSSEVTAEPKSEGAAEPEPKSEVEPEPSSDVSPEPSSEVTTEPASEVTAEPTGEPELESEPPSTQRPRFLSKAKRVINYGPVRERVTSSSSGRTKRNVEPKAEPEGEPSAGSSEPEPKTEPESQPNGEPEPKTEPESESEPKSESEPHAKSEPEPHSEPEGSSEPASESEPVSDDRMYKPHAYAPKHDFNPMDCTDIVIGAARNQTSRVFDYYTRDRSTPRQDEFWGGANDLTASAGFEENGVTTIIFRRKLTSTDVTDHSIVNDLMHVIWARGQEPGRYVHVPPSGLEKEKASMRDFYKPDELKYHGHRSQRGFTQLNFLEDAKPASSDKSAAAASNLLDNDCEGHWKHPRTCNPEKLDCEYFASWKTIGRGDEVRFTIQTTNTKSWTGIAFSENDRMAGSDAIIGWIQQNGQPFVMDTWITGYTPPKVDDQQNVYNVSGSLQNGATILEFTRKRESTDEKDLSFTNDHCLYLMFPIAGGRFNGVNKKTSKHEQTPIVTEARVCIKSCGLELASETEAPVKKAPTQLAYAVSVKLMNLAESFESPKKGTPEFGSLASQIANSMAGVLGQIPGYAETEVYLFQKNVDSVIAKMNVLFDKATFEKSLTVKTEQNNDLQPSTADADGSGEKVVRDTIRNSIQSAKLGALSVDPEFLEFRTLDLKIDDGSDEKSSFLNLSETRLYIVIGLIIALVLLAILQAICTIYQASSRSRNQKDKLIPNPAWKDYSANTNYAFDTTDTTMDDKQKRGTSRSSQQTLPLAHVPLKSQYYESSRHHAATASAPAPKYDAGHSNGSRYATSNGNEYYREPMANRTYSLPRQAAHAPSSRAQNPAYNETYYTHDRRHRSGHNSSNSHYYDEADTAPAYVDKPDFYFMPSQRKYSGEVVRVYVDYNKDAKK